MNKTNRRKALPQPKFAAIFDMDGVVVDNGDYHFKAWQDFARKHGVTLTKKYYFKHLDGRKSIDNARKILGQSISYKEARSFADERAKHYRRIYRPNLKPMPGLIRFLDSLRAAGIKCAIATSASKTNIRFIIGGLRLRHHFTTIVDAARVKHGKPHPEVYLKTAKKLGLPPQRCIVFEDALVGIESAHRAGMKVVGVVTAHPLEKLAHADLVVKDFRSLTVARLSALLDKS
jgi:beta-phosphoglucomutase